MNIKRAICLISHSSSCRNTNDKLGHNSTKRMFTTSTNNPPKQTTTTFLQSAERWWRYVEDGYYPMFSV